MDLQVIGSAVWRDRGLMAIGVTIGLLVGILAVARPMTSPPFLAYRNPEIWRSTATLSIQQSGFPEGAIVPSYTRPTPDVSPVQNGDPNRLSALTLLYAQLAAGDRVVRKAFGGKPAYGESIDVQALPAPPYQTPGTLPFLTVTTTATTPQRAVALARREGEAFVGYLQQHQSAAKIAESNRAIVEIFKAPSKPIVLQGRSKTMSIVAFLAVLTITLVIVLVRSNVQRTSTRRDVPRLETVESPSIVEPVENGEQQPRVARVGEAPSVARVGEAASGRRAGATLHVPGD